MIEGMVAGLAEKLKDDPHNLPGWLRLIRSYAVLGKNEEAATALKKALDVFGDDNAARDQLNELASAMKIEAKGS